eukprot:13891975-Alexandrium_andersonii.AAC.1
MMCIDDCAIIGSCNWATASRANNEVDMLVDLSPAGREQLESNWKSMFDGWMAAGTALRDAAPVHAQQT